jgi:hypothetical protein
MISSKWLVIFHPFFKFTETVNEINEALIFFSVWTEVVGDGAISRLSISQANVQVNLKMSIFCI